MAGWFLSASTDIQYKRHFWSFLPERFRVMKRPWYAQNVKYQRRLVLGPINGLNSVPCIQHRGSAMKFNMLFLLLIFILANCRETMMKLLRLLPSRLPT